MRLERFEDVDSWKEARLLVADIYKLLHDCRDFGYKDQIQRAAVSVMPNIADGFDRGSNREFIQFLVIARASVAEVRSLTYAGVDIGYFDRSSFETLMMRCSKITSLINGFIRFLKSSPRKG